MEIATNKSPQTAMLYFQCNPDDGVFANYWQNAIVTIMSKPGEVFTQTKPYRPVSLLPTTSKVFEKLLLQKLLLILERSNVKHDHNFRLGSSITHRISAPCCIRNK